MVQLICKRHGLGVLDTLRRKREKKGTDALKAIRPKGGLKKREIG